MTLRFSSVKAQRHSKLDSVSESNETKLMKKTYYIFTFLLLVVITTFAQDLSGHWKGTLLQSRITKNLLRILGRFFSINQLIN